MNSAYDQDYEFLGFGDQSEIGQEQLDLAMEHFEFVTFDVFNYGSVMGNEAFGYVVFKIFQKQDFFRKYDIEIETAYRFSHEIVQGYFKENTYHNQNHIIDSLQAMHYIMEVRSLKTLVQKHDIFAVFVANIIHDFEHPGYSNQFIVRTKHPIAIRYSDNCVLENHHLAAAF